MHQQVSQAQPPGRDPAGRGSAQGSPDLRGRGQLAQERTSFALCFPFTWGEGLLILFTFVVKDTEHKVDHFNRLLKKNKRTWFGGGGGDPD